MEDLWKLFYLWGLRPKNPLERMNEDFPSLDMLKDQAATYLQLLVAGPSGGAYSVGSGLAFALILLMVNITLNSGE